MAHFPGHRYLGPGSSRDAGDPVDEDDAVALVHDTAYDRVVKEAEQALAEWKDQGPNENYHAIGILKRARTQIRQADWDAIIDFSRQARTGNWHAIFGAGGLLIKYGLETVAGVQYPGELIDLGTLQKMPVQYHNHLGTNFKMPLLPLVN